MKKQPPKVAKAKSKRYDLSGWVDINKRLPKNEDMPIFYDDGNGLRALSQLTWAQATDAWWRPAFCQAAKSDGECCWKHCPQLRDGEPEKSGRGCPLPWWGDDDDY